MNQITFIFIGILIICSIEALLDRPLKTPEEIEQDFYNNLEGGLSWETHYNRQWTAVPYAHICNLFFIFMIPKTNGKVYFECLSKPAPKDSPPTILIMFFTDSFTRTPPPKEIDLVHCDCKAIIKTQTTGRDTELSNHQFYMSKQTGLNNYYRVERAGNGFYKLEDFIEITDIEKLNNYRENISVNNETLRINFDDQGETFFQIFPNS